VTCHSTCDTYKKQKAEWDEQREKIREYNMSNALICDWDFNHPDIKRKRKQKFNV
jgi:hypothetical protein